MAKIFFEKAAYKGVGVETIKRDLKEQGFEPILIEEKPNDFLQPHQHPESHILVQVDGEMMVSSESRKYKMLSGDKLTIPPEVEHGAKFGERGSKYLWIEY